MHIELIAVGEGGEYIGRFVEKVAETDPPPRYFVFNDTFVEVAFTDTASTLLEKWYQQRRYNEKR